MGNSEHSSSEFADEELIEDFVIESGEIADNLDRNLVKLENQPEEEDLLHKIFRGFHTIKGTSKALGFDMLSDLTHRAEEVLDLAREGEVVLSSSHIDVLLSAVDSIHQILDEIEGEGTVYTEVEPLKEKLEAICAGDEVVSDEQEKDEEQEGESEGEGPSALESTASSQKSSDSGIEVAETIRVDVSRLDHLMNLTGELVLARNWLLNVYEEFAPKRKEDDGFSGVADRIDQITDRLQEGVMKARMQPVKNLFERFYRTVRDLARDTDKKVQLQIKGEETEIDRTILEQLHDPLVHLLRNAVDHGIEPPEEREQKDKSPTGQVELEARHEGNYIHIYVRDDGRGIDPDHIREKAVERGLVNRSEIEQMDREQVFSYIFKPGFSTRDEVSDLSGRGVGMDVLKSSIERLNGTIEMRSEQDEGTEFLVSIPLTLSIIRSLIVEVGEDVFALPLVSVDEVIRPEREAVDQVQGKPVLYRDDQVVPILNTATLLDVQRENYRSQKENVPVIIASISEGQIGVQVDLIRGKEEVVIKPLGKYIEQKTDLFSGATILGDGEVVLILDPAGLYRLHETRYHK